MVQSSCAGLLANSSSDQSCLRQWHDSYQNSSHSPRLSLARFNLTVHNRGLKHQSFLLFCRRQRMEHTLPAMLVCVLGSGRAHPACLSIVSVDPASNPSSMPLRSVTASTIILSKHFSFPVVLFANKSMMSHEAICIMCTF